MRLLSAAQGLILVCFLSFALPGCGGVGDNGPASSSDKTMIRVHNVSTYDFENIVVGHHDYGAVAVDAFSGYAGQGVAYRYNYVKLSANGTDFVLQPIDYVGETPLGPGNFTYKINVTDFDGRILNIAAVKDESP